MSNVNLELQAMTDLAADRFRLMNNALATIKELKFTVKNLREEATMQIASSVKAFDRVKELEDRIKQLEDCWGDMPIPKHATKEDV